MHAWYPPAPEAYMFSAPFTAAAGVCRSLLRALVPFKATGYPIMGQL